VYRALGHHAPFVRLQGAGGAHAVTEVLSVAKAELDVESDERAVDYLSWMAAYLQYQMYPQDHSYGHQLGTLLVLGSDPGPSSAGRRRRGR